MIAFDRVTSRRALIWIKVVEVRAVLGDRRGKLCGLRAVFVAGEGSTPL